MAKKAKGKSSGKAAKKSTPKKGKKKSASVVKTEKPIEVDVTPMTDQETAIVELQEIGITPFNDPMSLSSAELEQRAVQLDRSKAQNEAELAAVLYAIEEKQVHVAHGWDRKDYYREHLQISYTKAAELVKNWRVLIEVGVTNIMRLSGLSWTKIKIIRKGIINGKITARNIETWLGRCIAAPGDKNFTSLEALENMVKSLISEADRNSMSKETKTVKFEIAAYEMQIVNQFEEIAKAALDTDNRGQWFLQAIIDFSSNYANLKDKKDAAFWKSRGLAALKELAERTAPVAAIFVPLSDDITAQKIGVAPTSHIFQGYKDGSSDPLFCVASSESEAKQFLGVKRVRMFPIMVAASLLPAAPFTVTPEIKIDEPAPEKAKPAKAAGAKTPTNLGTGGVVEAVKVMKSKDVKVEISRLVPYLGVSEAAYYSKKDELEKALPEGLDINQGLLCWLYNEEIKAAKKGSKKKTAAKKTAAKKTVTKKAPKKASKKGSGK